MEIYYKAFCDVWKVMKNSLPVQGTDEYWEHLLDNVHDTYNAYRGTVVDKLVRRILYEILCEVERLYKSEVIG